MRNAQDQHTLWPEHALDFAYNCGLIDNVLQDIQAQNCIKTGVLQWERLSRGLEIRSTGMPAPGPGNIAGRVVYTDRRIAFAGQLQCGESKGAAEVKHLAFAQR